MADGTEGLGAVVGRNQIRISKSEKNPKSECSKPRCEVAGSLDGTVSDFGYSHLEFVSSSVLRISGFEEFAHRARILTVCSAEIKKRPASPLVQCVRQTARLGE